MRARGRGAIVLFGVLLFASLFATIPTTAQEPGAGVMQSEDAKNLTYEQNTMYLYGSNDDGGSQSTWPMWTHSAPSDGNSDESLSESNVLGDENNGGGPRTFTWDGSNPPAEPTSIDNSVPITGAVHLTIVCNVEQDQCSKQVTIVLRLGNRDLAQQAIDQPDDDDYYHFEFYINDDEIPAEETFGLRLSFQKPQGFTDGYNLYFGNGESWMDIPVLAPYEPIIPGLDGEEYVSPYAQASGYNLENANSSSILGLIIWGVLGVSVFVGGFTFLPSIPFKEISILLTGLGILISMLVAPLLAGPLATGTAANPDDPDVWSIEELAQLEERDGTFLGDELVDGYTFTFYAEFDQVYTTKDGTETISGLGHENDAATLGAGEISKRGKEYAQLYFSLFHMDLRPGQAVLAEITIINTTNPISGESSFLPMYADPNGSPQIITVTVDGEDSTRYAIPHDACTLIGLDSSWGNYAHIATALGLLMGGIGFWMVFRQNRVDGDEDYEDEDMEDVLDDLEEF
jgi:hypothetical protein